MVIVPWSLCGCMSVVPFCQDNTLAVCAKLSDRRRRQGLRPLLLPAILSCAPDLQFGFHTHVCGLCQLLRKLRALLCLKKGRQPEIVSFSRRSLCFAKILSALKIARFPVATAVPSRLSLHPRTPRISPGATAARYACVYKDGGTGRFRDATLVRIRQPDRTAGTTVVRQNSGRL
jgi:hypothetical protein